MVSEYNWVCQMLQSWQEDSFLVHLSSYWCVLHKLWNLPLEAWFFFFLPKWKLASAVSWFHQSLLVSLKRDSLIQLNSNLNFLCWLKFLCMHVIPTGQWSETMRGRKKPLEIPSTCIHLADMKNLSNLNFEIVLDQVTCIRESSISIKP